MSVALRIPLASLAAVALAATAHAAPAPMGDTDYIAKTMTAAPLAVANGAAVVAMTKAGGMRTVRKGGNGWTCMIMPDATPMCADAGGMGWLHALLHHGQAPARPGFIYMLAGDHGTSNVAFGAEGPTPRNHWVVTGPHVMIVGPAARSSVGYPRGLDADPARPFVMWPGTPYEHLMIPVK